MDIYSNENIDLYYKYSEQEIIKRYEEMNTKIYQLIAGIFIFFAKDGVVIYNDILINNRFVMIESKIKAILDSYFSEEYTSIYNTLIKVYYNSYMLSMFNMLNGANIDLVFNQIPLEQVEEAIKQPISSLYIKDRIIKNKSNSLLRIKQSIIQNIIKGSDLKKLSKEVSNILNISRNQSMKISRTEINRIRNKGIERSYEEAENLGIQFKKVWLATLDNRTRDAHKKLDGQISDDKGYFHYNGHKTKSPSNFGVASLDINCRCTTIASMVNVNFKERKDNISKDIIKYSKYKDWAKQYQNP